MKVSPSVSPIWQSFARNRVLGGTRYERWDCLCCIFQLKILHEDESLSDITKEKGLGDENWNAWDNFFNSCSIKIVMKSDHFLKEYMQFQCYRTSSIKFVMSSVWFYWTKFEGRCASSWMWWFYHLNSRLKWYCWGSFSSRLWRGDTFP